MDNALYMVDCMRGLTLCARVCVCVYVGTGDRMCCV